MTAFLSQGDSPRILARAQRGDRAALDALCRAEWPVVYRIVAARVETRQEAEDLTQEVFLRALRRLEGYRSDSGSFRPYLIAVAHNLLRDRWRRRARLGREVVDVGSGAARAPAPDEAAIAAEERAALAAALARLPADQQQVLRLRLLERRPAAEAATVLGRSADAVRQLQHRALVALRAQLEGEDEGRVGHG